MPTGCPPPNLTPEAELARTRRRIPKFRGVIFQDDAWWAQSRLNQKWKIVGGPFASPGQAWTFYKATRKVRAFKSESTERIDALLALSDKILDRFEVETQRSVMDPTLKAWRALEPMGYESRARKR